jgi:hypothetical protein
MDQSGRPCQVDEAEFGFFVGASNTGIPVECHGNAACNQVMASKRAGVERRV